MTGIVCIVSRASAAAVIANAVGGAAELARGNLLNTVTAHLAAARAAGLAESPVTAGGLANEASSGPAKPPGQPAVPLTHEIPGVDILRLQEAAEFLSKQGVAAQPGMGCTGPVLLVAPVQAERSVGLLEHGGFLQR